MLVNINKIQNTGRCLTLLLVRRGEKEAARGVDGVAGSLALPATMSSSVWHDEEEGSKARRGWRRSSKLRKGSSKEGKGSDRRKGRDRQCDVDHGKIPRQDPPKGRNRRCNDQHDPLPLRRWRRQDGGVGYTLLWADLSANKANNKTRKIKRKRERVTLRHRRGSRSSEESKPLDHLVFRSTATIFLERAPGLLLDRFPFRKLELDWFWKVPTGTGLVLNTANWNWPAFEKWPKFDSKQPLLCKNLIKIANLPRFYELLVNTNINSATNQH